MYSKSFYATHSDQLDTDINDWLEGRNIEIVDVTVKMITDRNSRPCMLIFFLYKNIKEENK